MMSSPMMALMAAAMMVAMMLPSIAPTLWRYHRTGHAMRTARSMLFAVGYAAVWSGVGLAMYAVNTSLSPQPPWALGALLMGVGAVQRSEWKTRQLRRCRKACVTATPKHLMSAWGDGCRLGVHCALSCFAPMAVAVAASLMDVPVMLVVTVAITAERVAPGGYRIARLTGAVALIVGAIMCGRAVRVAGSRLDSPLSHAVRDGGHRYRVWQQHELFAIRVA